MTDRHPIHRTLIRCVVAGAIIALLGGARHRVSRGETYKSIAAKYDVDVDELRNINRKVRFKPGSVIIIPEPPVVPRWAPSAPYVPPAPTVGDLTAAIDRGDVVTIEADDRPGHYELYAGPDLDIKVGEVHPERMGNKKRYAYFLVPGIGGTPTKATASPLTKLGRTDSFRVPAVDATPVELDTRGLCPHP